jgi:hypothetical protein
MFKTALDLREYHSNEWVVLTDLIWESSISGQRITVPKGFITDLASIPAALRGILNVNGPSRSPAVVHDYLYCCQVLSRERSDEILREALESRGVDIITRNAFYSAVRSFGWIYWNKRLEDDNDHFHYDFVPPEYFNNH